MREICITPGGLIGFVTVGGAKACVPAIVGMALLNGDRLKLSSPAPLTSDLEEALQIVFQSTGRDVLIECPFRGPMRGSQSTRRRIRSRAVLPLLGIMAADGELNAPLPRGCRIGPRPYDLHQMVLQHFGYEMLQSIDGLLVRRVAPAQRCVLSIGRASIGASTQAILTAAVTPGTHVIANIVDSTEIRFLIACLNGAGIAGYDIHSAQKRVVVHGPIPAGVIEDVHVPNDGIELGSWLAAALLLGVDVRLPHSDAPEFARLVDWLVGHGAELREEGTNMRIHKQAQQLRIERIDTADGVHTDYLLPVAALAAASTNHPQLVDRIFPSRPLVFDRVRRDVAHGRFTVPDIRAGFAMCMMALDGRRTVHAIDDSILERGYPNLVQKFSSLDVRAVQVNGVGCQSSCVVA
jgi:UDP-N-acetylglucosamine 1-carboxyvinyltransferase